MPDIETTFDISAAKALPASDAPTIRPYVPERQRDWVRMLVTLGLLTPFVLIIYWAYRGSMAAPTQWAQTKEMLQIVLPALTGLLGSVIGFYFGSGAITNTRRSDHQ